VLASRNAPDAAAIGPVPTVVDLATASSLKIATASHHVLVAEDNPVNQQVIVRMLENRGCRVDVVATGVEAVAATGRSSYALVFMDCQMPVLDGFGATEAIRAREREAGNRRTPIVALTADARPETGTLCLKVGMDDYLAKPMTFAKLDSTLARWAQAPESPPDEAAGASHLASEVATTAMEAVVDPGVLADLAALADDEQPHFLEEVITAFLRDTPRQLTTLRDAVVLADPASIARAAHTLKGSSRTIGARELARLCADLETRSREAMPPDGPDVVAQIAAAFERVRRYFESSGVFKAATHS
jgi:CheY-like chemotaxis protein/HPt (histidine-containing phosphotransfer) domain-containing protein